MSAGVQVHLPHLYRANSENLNDQAKNIKRDKPQYKRSLSANVRLNYEEKRKKIENILKPFDLTDDDYNKVMRIMLDNFNNGLKKATNPSARVKMFQTYVKNVPDGTERGDFLALDLGGTNFRVLLISLDEKDVKMESKIYLIPQHIMLGPGTQLFDLIAECLFKFMKDHNLMDKVLPLGFTFSFPCRQIGLNKAILTNWTKGFKCEGVEGKDIVQLLHEAIERRGGYEVAECFHNQITESVWTRDRLGPTQHTFYSGQRNPRVMQEMNLRLRFQDIKVNCLAVINDTVGALMSCAHSDNKCAIGLILGTGTNACYIERLKNVELWDGDWDEPQQVIINTEWGALGDDGALDFIRTEYDKKVDRHSINPGKQIYEKMISGMYMGEIVRLILLKLRKHGLVFGGKKEMTNELETLGRFYTKYISEIESDTDDVGSQFKNTKLVFDDLHIQNYTEEDCRVVYRVCSFISKRAAYLASAGIATLLNKMQRPDVAVAVDGSLYRFHPHFHDLMMQKIQKLTDPLIKFRLMLSHDGSGKGAALVAAVADRVVKKQLIEGKVTS